jgi:hypothetical protein
MSRNGLSTPFPYSVSVRWSNATYERNHGTLKMECDFHVKVPHALHSGWKTRKTAAPLGPCHRLVMPGYDDSNLFLSCTHNFLQCTPPLLILQAPVCSRTHQHLYCFAITETNRQVQGRFSTRHITSVNNFGHFICLLLGFYWLCFCSNLTSSCRPGQCGKDVAQGGKVPLGHSSMHWTMCI